MHDLLARAGAAVDASGAGDANAMSADKAASKKTPERSATRSRSLTPEKAKAAGENAARPAAWDTLKKDFENTLTLLSKDGTPPRAAKRDAHTPDKENEQPGSLQKQKPGPPPLRAGSKRSAHTMIPRAKTAPPRTVRPPRPPTKVPRAPGKPLRAGAVARAVPRPVPQGRPRVRPRGEPGIRRLGGARRSVMPGARIELAAPWLAAPMPVAPRLAAPMPAAPRLAAPMPAVPRLAAPTAAGPAATKTGRTVAKGRKKGLSREVGAVVEWLKKCVAARKGDWKVRCGALAGFGGACEGLGGVVVGGRLAEDCVGMLGDYMGEMHHRVMTGALDGLFFLLLCSVGSCGHLQRALERRDDVLHRLLGMLGSGRENVRLAAGRVMQSFEVQFRPEAAVGLLLRAVRGSRGGVDGTVAERGAVQMAKAFERAAGSGEGFLWKGGLLENVLKSVAGMRRDRRVEVRRAAERVAGRVKESLPEGAYDLACGRYGIDV